MSEDGPDNEADKAFDAHQFESIYPDGIENHYWNHARNALIRDFLTKNHIEGPILEVGAGRGICTAFLRKAGIQIDGVEIAPARPIPAAEQWCRSGIDALELPLEVRNQYTALALFDIIEHLEHPARFLKELLVAFKSVRYVIVTVPAPPEVFSNYDVFNGHYRRYSRSILKDHLEGAGLRPIDVRYRFHCLLPASKLILRLKGVRNTEIKAPSGIVSRVVHRLAFLLLYWESTLLPGTWKGTSLFGAAERINQESGNV